MESIKRNKLTNKIDSQIESGLTAVRGRGIVGLGEMKGLRGKKPQKLLDTNNGMVITREEGVGTVEEGKGRVNGDGRRLDLGWGTHNTVYR